MSDDNPSGDRFDRRDSEMMRRVELIKSPDVRQHIREIAEAYLGGPIPKYQKQELYDAGVLSRDLENCASVLSNKECVTQTEMAEILNANYGDKLGKVFYRREISEILKGWRKRCVPWMREVETQNSAIIVAGFLKRFEESKGIATTSTTDDMPGIDISKARSAKAKADQDDRDNVEAQRKFDARWMMASAYEFFCEAFGVTARNTTRDLAERKIRIAVEEKINSRIYDEALRQTLIEDLRSVYTEQFESWQTEFCQRLSELDKETVENSDKQKKEIQK